MSQYQFLFFLIFIFIANFAIAQTSKTILGNPDDQVEIIPIKKKKFVPDFRLLIAEGILEKPPFEVTLILPTEPNKKVAGS